VRSTLLLSAALILAPVCFGQRAVPSLDPAFEPKLPRHIRLGKDFKEFAPKLPTRSFLFSEAPPWAADARCGHILVFAKPPALDAGILAPVPERSTAPMPKHKGLRACPEDIR
jgi:hypothetical protein